MRDREYYTALMWSVMADQQECLRALRECNHNALDMQGRSALILAVIHRKQHLLQDLLWESDVDIVDSAGCSALVHACKSGQLGAAKILCDYSADVDRTDNLRRTTLMHAARWGFLDLCKILVDRDVDVDAKDKRGWTALMFAAFWDQKECLNFLLDNRADVNIRERNTGKTALILCAEKSLEEVVSILLENEADPLIKDIYGKTALDVGVGVLIKAALKERMEQRLLELPSATSSDSSSSQNDEDDDDNSYS